MAYSTVSAPAASGFSLRAALSTLADAWRQRREYKRTVNELRALSNRELADIGLHRSGIRGVAREQVYGRL
ncbi:DUF1127 domain-containing protein [Cribrihabitans neustonicus]|uniref:DUF1127 domain-containing protein n=1 Tax=Cribrihabitans neustonicus TaxID=1429085 RepID=UPI003B5B7194